ncbi:MAG: trypsin-like peptidase domain-containing protein [Ruminococcus callidus]
MADFENKNNAQWNENGAAQNAGNTTNNSGAANTAAPAGNAGSGVNGAANPYAYQNGYYRNTTPHQDEAVHSGAYQQQNAAGSAYNNPAGGQTTPTGNGGSGNNGGYSYVNYYSDPNGGDPNKKPKKKHTGLKVAAFVLAMVLVSGGSIGVYEGIRSSNADNSSSIVASNDSSAAESSTGDSSSSKKSDSSQSWIQLASTNGSMSVADIVKKVTPSVVGVQSTFSSSNGSNNNPMNGYGGFFGYGSQGNNGSQGMTGVGTGIIMSKDGYIVTNAHVIYDDEYGYGEASSVQIQMSDEETTYDARIVAYDKEADIAVLKIDADNLTPAEFGDSSSCEVGEMVVAIGNPLGLQFQNTVTCGIISALDRKVTINDNTMTLIQTDTAINNGNSGGPLINSSGQVIGINSAKMSSTYSGEATVEGIGFAIPMSEAKSIVDDLINYGYVTGRPQLGISCQDVTEAVSQAYNIPVGAYIFSVTAGGAADQAGLQPGDVITGIQDQTISTTEELNAVKNQYKAGDTITLTYVRAGETKKVDVTLAEVQQTENN